MEELESVSKVVPTQYIIWTILVIIALIAICAKAFPKIKDWFEATRTKVNDKDALIKSVNEHEKEIEKIHQDISEINQKIGRAQARVNQIQQINVRQQKYIEESLEERELIIKSLLGVVQGLQEVGANGPTKKAEAEIQAYLLKKSHQSDINDRED